MMRDVQIIDQAPDKGARAQAPIAWRKSELRKCKILTREKRQWRLQPEEI